MKPGDLLILRLKNRLTGDADTAVVATHSHAHAAVKGQLEQDPLVRGAFEKLVATGTTTHHAEHVLGALLLETEWETARAVEAGKDPEKAQKRYIRKLEKLIREIAYRKKATRQFGADHSAFE